VESLSAYARQFLERIEKPDVDLIDGLAPAIAIKQKNSTRNPRSTVATATEIYDYLRLLYARCGTVHCLVCDGLVKRDSIDEIAGSAGAGRRNAAAGAVSGGERGRVRRADREGRGEGDQGGGEGWANDWEGCRETRGDGRDSPHTETLKARLTELRAGGFNRLYQQGKIVEFSTPESLLDLDFTLPVFVLLDRIVVSAENRARIVDAAEIAYREGGEVIFEEALRTAGDRGVEWRWAMSRGGGGFEPEPRLFSFNNPFGACPRCQGFGNTVDFDMNLVIPDKGKTLAMGRSIRGTGRSIEAGTTELR
jgi:excinuclease ABC subunit A